MSIQYTILLDTVTVLRLYHIIFMLFLLENLEYNIRYIPPINEPNRMLNTDQTIRKTDISIFVLFELDFIFI